MGGEARGWMGQGEARWSEVETRLLRVGDCNFRHVVLHLQARRLASLRDSLMKEDK